MPDAATAATVSSPDTSAALWADIDASLGSDPAAAVLSRVRHLRDRFRPEIANRLVASWTLDLGPDGLWAIHVANGSCHLVVGEASNPVARLTTDAATWVAIVDGRVDGIQAFLAGRLTIRGDLNLAVRLETLFRPGPQATRPVEVRRSQIRGLTIESLVVGHGRPVVLLHGLAAHKISFVPTLAALAEAGNQVHALDLPGFGKSDKPLPSGRRYSMPWMAQQVRAYLQHHHLEHAILVGNSMGGRIATEVALGDPRSVAGIVGLGAAVAFDEWQRFGRLLGRSQFHWAAATPTPIRADWVAGFIRRTLFEPESPLPDDNYLAAAEDVMLSIRDPRYRMATAACARHLIRQRAEGQDGYWNRLRSLAVPSLWIWGKRDQLVSSRYAERVSRVVPGADVQVWDGIGHVPQFEAPARTNAAILDFIARVDG